jgi:hypothetical protein
MAGVLAYFVLLGGAIAVAIGLFYSLRLVKLI